MAANHRQRRGDPGTTPRRVRRLPGRAALAVALLAVTTVLTNRSPGPAEGAPTAVRPVAQGSPIQDRLDLWVRADSGTSTTTDGGRVASWLDQRSGSTTLVTQTVSGSQPTFESDPASTVNFNPTLDFGASGTDWFETNLPVTPDTKPNWSVFAVYDTNAPKAQATPGALWGSENSSGPSWDRSLAGSDPQEGTTTGSGPAPVSPLLFTPGRVRMGSALFQQGVAGGSSQSVNGVVQATFTANHTNDAAPLQIGRRGTVNQTDVPWKGRIAEMLAYRAVDPATSSRARSYLALKYGLTLGDADGAAGGNVGINYVSPDGTVTWDGAANVAYQNDVAGIAQFSSTPLDQRISTSTNIPFGSSLIVANGAFTIRPGARPTDPPAFADDGSFVWGHDNGSIATVEPVTDPAARAAGIDRRISRVYRTQATAATVRTAGPLTFAVPADHVPAGFVNPSLLVSNNPAFSSGFVHAAPLTFDPAINMWTTTMPSPETAYVTVAGAAPAATWLRKSFSPAVLTVGGTTRATFAITKDPGAAASTALAFTDTLPPGLRVAPIPAVTNDCGGSVSAPALGSAISLVGGNLAQGPNDCALAVDVTTAPDLTSARACPDPLLTNGHAAMSGLSPDLSLAIDFEVCVPTVTSADLAVTATTGAAPPGGTGSSTVAVRNRGPSPSSAASLRITAPVGAATITEPVDPRCLRTTRLSDVDCTVDALAPDGVAPPYVVSFAVNPDAAPGATLTGAATTFSSQDAVSGNDTAAPAVVVGARSADLMVTSVSEPTITPGLTGPVAVSVRNDGPSDSPAATLSYHAPDGATVAGAGSPGCTLADGVATCDLPAIPAGGTRTIDLTVGLPPDSDAALSPLIRPGGVTVTLAGDPDGADNLADSRITVGPPEVHLTLAVGDVTLVPGQPGTIDVALTNAGPSDLAGATGRIEVVVPDGITLAAAVPPTANLDCASAVSVAPTIVTCRFTVTGRFAVGQSGSIAIPVVAASSLAPGTPPPVPVPPEVRLRFESGPFTDLDTPFAITIGGRVADLYAEVNRPRATPGGPAAYQLGVVNGGPSDTLDTVVTFDLPTNVAFAAADAACSYNDPARRVTCTSGPVARGGRVTYPVTVTVPASSSTPVDSGSVRVSSTSAVDPDAVDDTVEPTPLDYDTSQNDLRLTTNSPLQIVPGVTHTLNLSITNNGPSNVDNPRVTWVVPPGGPLLVDASDPLMPAPCGLVAGTLTCGLTGSFAPGEQRFAVPVRVAPDAVPGTALPGGPADATADTLDPDPANNHADVLVTVLAPRADTSVTVSSPSLVPGTSATATMRATNAGPSRAAPATMTYTLPPRLLADVTQPAGCTSAPDRLMVTCAVPALGPGASAAFNLAVTLDAAAPAGAASGGSVALTIDAADPVTANNTLAPTTYTALAPRADLAVTVAQSTLVPGTPGAMTVRVANVGPSTDPAVEVTIVLPSAAAAPVSPAGPLPTTGVSCAVGPPILCLLTAPLTPGAAVDIVLPVVASAAAEPGSYTSGQASVFSPTTDHVATNDAYAIHYTVAERQADLTVTADIPVVVPGAGGILTVVAGNPVGPSLAAAPLLDIALPADLLIDTGATLPAGCTIVDASHLGCVTGSAMAPGDTFTAAVPVRLPSSAPAGPLTGGLARVDSPTFDPDGADNSTAVAARADTPRDSLRLVYAPPPPIAPGAQGDNTITVVNDGPSDATDVSYTRTFPAGFSVVATQRCDSTTGTVTCAVGTLRPGESVSRVRTLFTESTVSPSSLVLAPIVIHSTTGGPVVEPQDVVDNPGTIVTAAPAVDLEWSKTAALAPYNVDLNAGEPFTYTLSVVNHGPSIATNVTMTDTLPAPISFVSSPDGCTAVGPDVTCPGAASLLPETEQVRRFDVRLAPDYLGDGSDLGNSLVVGTDTALTVPDPTPPPQPTPAPDLGPPTADLRWTMTTALVGRDPWLDPGDLYAYTLTATNNGPSTARDVHLGATMPAAVSFDSSTDGCTAVGPAVTCPPVATLDPGASATRTWIVRLASTYAGTGADLLASAVVGSATELAAPDPTPPPPPTPAPPLRPRVGASVPDVVITAAADRSSARLGDVVRVTVTVTRTRATPLTDVSVTGDLAGVLDDATWNDDAAATTGSVVLDGTRFTWTAGVAAGVTASLSFAVTVGDRTAGDHRLVQPVTGPPESNCAVGSVDPACTAAVGVALVHWRIAVDRPSAVAGERLVYTITATNTGTGVFVGAAVVDDLSGVLAHATFDDGATGGAVFDPATRRLTWRGDVPAGGTATVSYRVTAADVDAETVVDNPIRSDDPGSNCTTGVDPDCSVSATILPASAVLAASLPVTGWAPRLLGAALLCLGAGGALIVTRRRLRSGRLLR
jgi:uncharacterized repeat protein (TIGR01451 family)